MRGMVATAAMPAAAPKKRRRDNDGMKSLLGADEPGVARWRMIVAGRDRRLNSNSIESASGLRSAVLGRRGASAHLALRQTKRAAEKPPFVVLRASKDYSPAASRGGASAAFCLASRSSPVTWSTTFIDKRVLPRSSKPSSLTLTLSPSLTTSEVFCTRLDASWLIWTRPSLAP